MFIGISDHKEMLQKIYPVFVNTVLRHSVIYDNFNVILEGILERNPEAAPSVHSHSVIYGNFNVIWEGILERNPLAASSGQSLLPIQLAWRDLTMDWETFQLHPVFKVIFLVRSLAEPFKSALGLRNLTAA